MITSVKKASLGRGDLLCGRSWPMECRWLTYKDWVKALVQLWTCGEALGVRGARAERLHMGDPSLKALPGQSRMEKGTPKRT